MRKILQNTAIRAVCMLVLGVLFIAYAHDMSRWLVMATGLLFVIPGCVSLVAWFMREAGSRSFILYPIVATGCVLFGIIQIAMPELFTDALRYILTSILIIAAAAQCLTLWKLHQGGIKKMGAFILFPITEFVIALAVMLSTANTLPLQYAPLLIGCGYVIYALLELVTLALMRRLPRVQKSPTLSNNVAEVIEAEAISASKDHTSQQ